ncbi:MAG: arginine--tRNA ligase [Oscillospiraceae bacterium]|jgi:arginyl-tRNA synthetase|nr:arginine--tRNA ligase [Oscillospiraceae bacterium]
MSFTTVLDGILRDCFAACGYAPGGGLAKYSDRPDLCQFQCNEAFKIAKEQKKNPRDVAGQIVRQLEGYDIFAAISIAGPGFINLTLRDDFLAKHVEEMATAPNMGIPQRARRKIIIDFGGANVAKPLHVGHLRSAIIGEGLKRLARELGHEVIGDVHLGDWGRQMGIIISEIRRRKPELVYFDETFTGAYPAESPVTIEELDEIYPTASAAAKEDEERMQEAREATATLQNQERPGHRGYYALWKHMVAVSIRDLKENYDKLGVCFDLWRGESDCFKSIPAMTDFLRAKNLLRESDGAIIMDVAEPDEAAPLPPVIIKTKSDSVGYQTTELATLWERVHEFAPDEVWYVVDGRQSLHFKQIFRAAYQSGIASEDLTLAFIDFGTMNGKDGKPFKTRDGGVMKLGDLLALVQQSAKGKYDDDEAYHLSEAEKEALSFPIADATIKYADALSHRSTDYIFDIEKFTATQGKTGPYILYSAVRMHSLLKKAEEKGLPPGPLMPPTRDDERNLLLTLARLPDVVEAAYRYKSLTDIADYLFELNSAYNVFYTENRILSEEDEAKRASWLGLTAIAERMNKKLLGIMAISIPERM